MRFKKIVSVLAAGMLMFGLAVPVMAQEEAAVQAGQKPVLTVSDATVSQAGQTATVSVQLVSSQTVGALEFDLVCGSDATCRTVSVLSGNYRQMKRNGNRISFAYANAKGMSGNHALLQFTVQINANTSVGITNLKAWDTQRNTMSITSKTGSLTVGTALTVAPKVEPETTVAQLIQQVGSCTVLSASGKALSAQDYVTTGCTLLIGDQRFTIVIYGDVNGDGFVDVLDLVSMQNALLGKSRLMGCYAQAADIDQNGEMDILDLIQVQNHILGRKTIVQ